MKQFKRLTAVIISLIMIITMASCAGKSGDKSSGSGSAASSKIVIAYIGPLTGEASAFGIPEVNTLKMLVEKQNQEGGIIGKQVELKTYDNRNDNVETTNAAKKAIQNDGVSAIIGCNASGPTLALSSVCDELKVPNVATTATNSKVTVADGGKVRPFTFRVCLADPQLGDIMAKYAYEKLNIKKVAILYQVSSDYSTGITQNFTDSFTKAGGSITDKEAYKTGDVDFRAQLEKIKESSPDALFLPLEYKELGLATKQARSLGITQQFLGPDCWMANDLFSVAGDAIKGSMFVAPIDGSDPSLNDFKTWYRSKNNNEEPDQAGSNAYFAYDAFVFLKAAIEKANSTDPVAIRDAMEKTTDIQGLTGKITMMPDTHNPIRSANIFRVDADKFTSIEKFTVQY
ncbi:MAG: ABC transporter substrate-binding protein [Bacillota bacterium]|nr:ABC transporter substrate-binding protein [Bacillota bacterium]